MLLLDSIIFDLQKYGGVSNVWKAILKSLATSNIEQIGILKSKADNSFCNKMFTNHISDRNLPVFINRYLNVNTKNVEVFHSSYFRVHKSRKVKNIVTVHDFTYEKFDSGIRKWIHLKQKNHALKKASAIICVSENTKNDLLEYHPWINPEIVKVIYNGYDKNMFFPLEIKEGNNSLENNYLLSVGGRNIHKNFEFTLSLMSLPFVREQMLKLIVVGGGTFSKRELELINRNNIADLILHKVNVTDQELNVLYNNAFALVYPSLYEGFGIPPLEAMAAGCPVICSSTSSLPEVVGSNGLYIDTKNPKSAIPYIKNLMNEEERAAIIENGLIQAKKFSWEKTGQETINLYKKLLEK